MSQDSASIQPRTQLYANFADLKKPTGNQFAELINSFIHRTDDYITIDKSSGKIGMAKTGGDVALTVSGSTTTNVLTVEQLANAKQLNLTDNGSSYLLGVNASGEFTIETGGAAVLTLDASGQLILGGGGSSSTGSTIKGTLKIEDQSNTDGFLIKSEGAAGLNFYHTDSASTKLLTLQEDGQLDVHSAISLKQNSGGTIQAGATGLELKSSNRTYLFGNNGNLTVPGGISANSGTISAANLSAGTNVTANEVQINAVGGGSDTVLVNSSGAFKVHPQGSSTNAQLFISTSSQIGLGTDDPQAALHVANGHVLRLDVAGGGSYTALSASTQDNGTLLSLGVEKSGNTQNVLGLFADNTDQYAALDGNLHIVSNGSNQYYELTASGDQLNVNYKNPDGSGSTNNLFSLDASSGTLSINGQNLISGAGSGGNSGGGNSGGTTIDLTNANFQQLTIQEGANDTEGILFDVGSNGSNYQLNIIGTTNGGPTIASFSDAGTVTINAATTINNTLDVTGTTTLADTSATTLSSSAKATLESLDVTNAANLLGGVTVTGTSSLGAASATTLGSSAKATLDSLDVTNATNLLGGAAITGDASVSGVLTLGSVNNAASTVATPVAGMIVFDTSDATFKGYDGSGWVSLSLTADAGTNSGGTGDNSGGTGDNSGGIGDGGTGDTGDNSGGTGDNSGGDTGDGGSGGGTDGTVNTGA